MRAYTPYKQKLLMFTEVSGNRTFKFAWHKTYTKFSYSCKGKVIKGMADGSPTSNVQGL